MGKQTAHRIVIDDEFKGMMMPLTDHQRDQLEWNLSHEGCRDALVLWKGKDILLDGYNRTRSAQDLRSPSRSGRLSWLIVRQHVPGYGRTSSDAGI